MGSGNVDFRDDEPTKDEPQRGLLKGRMKWLLGKPTTADVHFVVGNKDQGIEHFRAHKAIMASASDVYYSMFYGKLESPNEVEVPDGTPEAFRVLLRFIYTNEIVMDDSNAFEVHYLAEKYMIEGLKNAAAEDIKKSITSLNVLDMLQGTAMVDDIESYCWQIIDTEARDVLESEAFLKLTHGLLMRIISRSELDVAEFTVYERTIEWAKAELQRTDTEINAKNVRDVLGEAFYEIRYGNLYVEQFARGPANEDYLTDEEKLAFFKYKYNGEAPPRFKVGTRATVWPLLPSERRSQSAVLEFRTNY